MITLLGRDWWRWKVIHANKNKYFRHTQMLLSRCLLLSVYHIQSQILMRHPYIGSSLWVLVLHIFFSWTVKCEKWNQVHAWTVHKEVWFGPGRMESLRESAAVPTARSCADGKISGPSAQGSFRPGQQANRCHRKTVSTGRSVPTATVGIVLAAGTASSPWWWGNSVRPMPTASAHISALCRQQSRRHSYFPF
jgi:hypothetical protein